MRWLLGQVTGFFGVSPYQLLIISAVVALAFTLGLAKGNHWATSRAIEATAEAVNKARDAEMARSAVALQEQSKRLSAELKARADANYQAAHAAYKVVLKERDAASKASKRAEAVLKHEQEISDGLRKVNEILANESPPVAGCVFSPRVRSALDELSGASDPITGGDTTTSGTTVPSGAAEESAASPDQLTCEQLLRGYGELAVWGREGWSMYDAWRAYWKGLYP